MRAQFLEGLTLQDQYLLKGDEAHHLLHVARIEVGEEVLLLNGRGLMVWTVVESLGKKDIVLKKLRESKIGQLSKYDLILGIPKKDALELSLKQAVELGFRKIFLIRAAYSQIKIPETERMQSLLINALEQSNAAFLPEIIATGWKELNFSEYSEVVLLDSQSQTTRPLKQGNSQLSALVVGPEGGFSQDELSFLHGLPNAAVVRLPCPLLRTPTAVAAGAGVLMGRLLD
jgi:16S rRNA (uracil1498-N3)-methyltransferase